MSKVHVLYVYVLSFFRKAKNLIHLYVVIQRTAKELSLVVLFQIWKVKIMEKNFAHAKKIKLQKQFSWKVRRRANFRKIKEDKATGITFKFDSEEISKV